MLCSLAVARGWLGVFQEWNGLTMVTYILQNGGSWKRSCQCQALKKKIKKKKNHGYTSQLKAGDPSKFIHVQSRRGNWRHDERGVQCFSYFYRPLTGFWVACTKCSLLCLVYQPSVSPGSRCRQHYWQKLLNKLQQNDLEQLIILGNSTCLITKPDSNP